MQRWTALTALALLLFGTYLLLVRLEPAVPDLAQIWPILLFICGLFLLVDYLRSERQRPTGVFWGTMLVLDSIFLLFFTLGPAGYAALGTWWPVFIVIAGIALLAFWLAQGRQDWGPLFLAVVGLLFGVARLAVNLYPGAAREMDDLSPAIIIMVGLILLLRRAQARRQGDDG